MNKLLSCHYNMDTNRVEAQFADGSAVAIDCIAIEDEYGNTPACNQGGTALGASLFYAIVFFIFVGDFL